MGKVAQSDGLTRARPARITRWKDDNQYQTNGNFRLREAASFNHALQRPAIALRLQYTRPVGRVAELGSFVAT